MTSDCPDQIELFDNAVYQSRVSTPVSNDMMVLKISNAMAKMAKAAKAAKECGLSRARIANRMAEYPGFDRITKHSLNACISPSKTSHNISLIRFSAFVHATSANWLWDEVVQYSGLTVLEGDEARLAEIARLEQEQKRLRAELNRLKINPVKPAKWRGR